MSNREEIRQAILSAPKNSPSIKEIYEAAKNGDPEAQARVAELDESVAKLRESLASIQNINLACAVPVAKLRESLASIQNINLACAVPNLTLPKLPDIKITHFDSGLSKTLASIQDITKFNTCFDELGKSIKESLRTPNEAIKRMEEAFKGQNESIKRMEEAFKGQNESIKAAQKCISDTFDSVSKTKSLFIKESPILSSLYSNFFLTTNKIASVADVSKGSVSYWLKKHDIPTRRTGGTANFKDITGEQFDRLEVIERYHGGKNKNGAKWICKCSCGNTTIVSRRSLVNGLTRSCGCLKKELAFQGHGDLSLCYWNRIIKGANKRGLAIGITIEDAWNLFQHQNKRCALSGMEIQIVRDYTRHNHEHTASLDRKNNEIGYTKDNVQWVHRDLNMMRRNLPLEVFVDFCRKVAQHYESQTS